MTLCFKAGFKILTFMILQGFEWLSYIGQNINLFPVLANFSIVSYRQIRHVADNTHDNMASRPPVHKQLSINILNMNNTQSANIKHTYSRQLSGSIHWCLHCHLT